MQHKEEEYPEQFYGCPRRFNSSFEKNTFLAKIMTAVANEIHSLRMELKKQNEKKTE